MSVNRKIFLAMASFILVFSLVFLVLTFHVVRGALGAMASIARGEELNVLTDRITDYYKQNGQSWKGLAESGIGIGDRADASYLIVSPKGELLVHAGNVWERQIRALGLKRSLRLDGEQIGILYYYDREASVFAKLRIGIPGSVAFLLAAGVILFLCIALIVAYWIAKRLTAPIRRLTPAVEKIGSGDFSVQVPVTTRDEYGKLGTAFNSMTAQLRRSEELRRNLVADVAHELRTPLTIVQGKLDYFQQNGKPVEPESLLPVQDELIRLTRLVDDLHRLSQAEAKKLPFSFRQADMLELLEHTAERVRQAAQDKGIDLTLSSDAARTRLTVDPQRMTQVFLNLLMNAIRYTPSGGTISIRLEEERVPDRPDMLRITVADSGPGIAPEHLPRLFDRFYRTEEDRGRESGGMGLGLAIAKEFVLAHNGTIEAESRPGAGAAFIVRLPFGRGGGSEGGNPVSALPCAKPGGG